MRKMAAVGVLVGILGAACSKEESATPVAPPASGTHSSVERRDDTSATFRADAEINQWLLDVLAQHKIDASGDGEWIAFRGSPVRMNGRVFSENRHENASVVQVDFRLALADGRVIVQQLAGFGEDRGAAVAQAQIGFLLGTFH